MRINVMMAFVKACFQPLIDLHNDFLLYRKAKLYQIAMNYQVCYLEALLNDRYDFTQRRIYIDDADTGDQVYIYQDDEDAPLYMQQESENDPLYLFTEGETIGDHTNDFIIHIPATVAYSESEIRAMIATKLCGKRYKIEIF